MLKQLKNKKHNQVLCGALLVIFLPLSSMSKPNANTYFPPGHPARVQVGQTLEHPKMHSRLAVLFDNQCCVGVIALFPVTSQADQMVHHALSSKCQPWVLATSSHSVTSFESVTCPQVHRAVCQKVNSVCFAHGAGLGWPVSCWLLKPVNCCRVFFPFSESNLKEQHPLPKQKWNPLPSSLLLPVCAQLQHTEAQWPDG